MRRLIAVGALTLTLGATMASAAQAAEVRPMTAVHPAAPMEWHWVHAWTFKEDCEGAANRANQEDPRHYYTCFLEELDDDPWSEWWTDRP